MKKANESAQGNNRQNPFKQGQTVSQSLRKTASVKLTKANRQRVARVPVVKTQFAESERRSFPPLIESARAALANRHGLNHGDIAAAARISALADIDGGLSWLLEMGQQIVKENREFEARVGEESGPAPRPILPDEFSRPLWDAFQTLHEAVNRAHGFLYLVSSVHAQMCYDMEMAPIETAKADSMEYLAGDIAEMLEKKTQAVFDEITTLRTRSADGRPAGIAAAAPARE